MITKEAEIVGRYAYSRSPSCMYTLFVHLSLTPISLSIRHLFDIAVQHTWQKFLAKKKPLAVKAAQKTSMFASSDAVDAKVGVIGSGKGITKVEYERKKHKF